MCIQTLNVIDSRGVKPVRHFLPGCSTLDIHSPIRSEVFFLGPAPDASMSSLLQCLDRAGIAVIADVPEQAYCQERFDRIAGGCSGLISVFSRKRLDQGVAGWRDLMELNEIARERPHLVLWEDGLDARVSLLDKEARVSIGPFLEFSVLQSSMHGVCGFRWEDIESCSKSINNVIEAYITAVCEIPVTPPYAFMIGRMERDFSQARQAIRAAVEKNIGMTCLWSDDGRHNIKTQSVRLATELLLENAALVIADLTLGPENPRKENPSRAHEIGLSMAFDRRLMLCSREPRRYPYFSIGDQQMFFWSDENDLYQRTSHWLLAERESIGRTVLNHRLQEWEASYAPVISPLPFVFDRKLRYRWPQTRPYTDLEILAIAAGLGGIATTALFHTGLDNAMGRTVYTVGGLLAAITLLVLPSWSSLLCRLFGRAARVLPSVLLLGAFAYASVVLIDLPQ